MKTLSQTLRAFAASHGMTHRQGQINVGALASRLGVPKPTLNNWLADESKPYHKEPTGLARVALRAIVGDWDRQDTSNLCQSCNNNPGKSPHECPYHSDVNNDHEFACNCCKDCEQRCALDYLET